MCSSIAVCKYSFFITLSPKVVYSSELKYNGLFIQNFKEGCKTQQQPNKTAIMSR